MTLPERLWIYQRERFPLLAHGLLIAAFSSSAICFSALLRGESHFPPWHVLVAGFISSLLLFLQLRISDEHKDAEDDARYRPYRAVPRGIVTLKQLSVIGWIAAAVQVLVAVFVTPKLLPLIALVWIYLWLMSNEFFVSSWLKAHPIIYLLSHMVIMPLIDLYISAFDWMRNGGHPPSGLAWFLFVSFFNGIVVEFGRKIRTPHDEEHGVETYSSLWGTRTATGAWIVATIVTAAFAAGAANAIGIFRTNALIYCVAIATAACIGARFAMQPTTTRSKTIEAASGIWTLLMYLSLGLGPMAFRAFAA